MRQHRPVDEGLSMENAIEIRHLAYSYPDDTSTEHVVFQDLSLDIEQGSFVAVLGHNGCGKSTLAKHLNAILLPEGGTVTVYGLDTKQEENLLAIRQQVGMVFQNPDNQIVSNVVEEDVAFAPENLGVPTQEIRRRVDEALEAVGMAAYKSTRRTCFRAARSSALRSRACSRCGPRPSCLTSRPRCWTRRGRQEVVSIVEKLSREQNITVILITHHMDEAICADRVIAMDDGKIIADGAPKDVFTKIDLLQSVGLTAPQTTLLLKALDDDGCALPLDALSVDDCAQALLRQISQAKA